MPLAEILFAVLEANMSSFPQHSSSQRSSSKDVSAHQASSQRKSPPLLDRLWFTRCPVPTATGLAYKLGWLDEEFAGDGIAADWAAANVNEVLGILQSETASSAIGGDRSAFAA